MGISLCMQSMGLWDEFFVMFMTGSIFGILDYLASWRRKAPAQRLRLRITCVCWFSLRNRRKLILSSLLYYTTFGLNFV